MRLAIALAVAALALPALPGDARAEEPCLDESEPTVAPAAQVDPFPVENQAPERLVTDFSAYDDGRPKHESEVEDPGPACGPHG